MAKSTLAEIIIPVVVLLVLAVWIFAVYRADRRPGRGSSHAGPGREVAGGAFRATGGRQQMPRRDAPVAEATPQDDRTGQQPPGSATG